MAEGSSLEYDFKDLWRSIAPDLDLVGPDSTMLSDIINMETDRATGQPPREITHRLDFLVEGTNIIIEINGGNYSRQRRGHSTGKGLNKDYYKMLVAQLGGYQLYYLDTKMAVDVELITLLTKHARSLKGSGIVVGPKLPNVYQCISYQDNKKKSTQYAKAATGLHAWLSSSEGKSLTNVGNLSEVLAKVLLHMPKSKRARPSIYTVKAVLTDFGFLEGKHYVKAEQKFKTTYVKPGGLDVDSLLLPPDN